MRSRKEGVTLVELIITITVMTLILASVMPLFFTTQRGFTTLEVNSVLPAATQEALNHIQHRLAESKRIFGNDAVGKSFLALVSPSPAAAPGSLLPVIASTASLTPASPAFSAGNVGNSLFFASVAAPLELKDINTTAGPTVSVRMDTFLFNYYYLSRDSSDHLGGKPRLELWEWHSVPYADYLQLGGITDGTKRTDAASELFKNGVEFAWDSSTSDKAAAFYSLNNAGDITSVPAHTLVVSSGRDAPRKMISLIRGAASGGFKYSVSANTGGPFTHKYQVPRYAAPDAATGFPGGFEVMTVGANSARQVFLRLVVAAQGNFKGYMSFENVVLVTARDLW
jgi:type II secretory pathway pseudopilin PulG